MRILMHAVSSPAAPLSHYEVLSESAPIFNYGELIFAYSLSRALMTDDVEIEYMNLELELSDKQIAEIDERYDALVLPIANVFRQGYVTKLNRMTKLVKNTSMPVMVPCCGYQGKFTTEINEPRPFDEASRAFVDAVLEKGPRLGLRGEITATYLEHLGYVRDKDFSVIGCPSLRLYGKDLPRPKPLQVRPDMRINLNSKVSLPKKLHDFLRRISQEYPNSNLVPQNAYELNLLYSGTPLRITHFKPSSIKNATYYPQDVSDPMYVEDRVRGFIDVPSWFDFISKGDLNLGSRIHGNVFGVLNGVPALIIACDVRVAELASYHNIPHIKLPDLDENASLEELVDGIDFAQVLDGHEERFDKYLDFLHSHGYETVFDNGTPEGDTPFDKLIKSQKFAGPIVTLGAAKPEEMADRMSRWEPLLVQHDKRMARQKAKKKRESKPEGASPKSTPKAEPKGFASRLKRRLRKAK